MITVLSPVCWRSSALLSHLCCRQDAQAPGSVSFLEEGLGVAVTFHLLKEPYSSRLSRCWLGTDRSQERSDDVKDPAWRQAKNPASQELPGEDNIKGVKEGG